MILRDKGCHLLFSDESVKPASAHWLAKDFLNQVDNSQKISTGGRGQAWFVQFAGLSLVYRCYLRGGLLAKLIKQTYFGFAVESSRSFKEYRLLQWMSEKGLPVPQAVAASMCRWPFALSPLYRAHILISRIPNVKTLNELLLEFNQSDEVWVSIGQCLRHFHNLNIYHADLNAHNILLNNQGAVYLIDFDKGEVRENKNNVFWKQENIERLKRSLLKQLNIHESYFFNDDAWCNLMMGYENIK